jgi:hypothetical protein
MKEQCGANLWISTMNYLTTLKLRILTRGIVKFGTGVLGQSP